MAKSKNKGRVSFAGIPRHVMDHPDFYNLSGNAQKLLLELARQYKGDNNGDLTVAYSLLKSRGFRSKATIGKSRDKLLEAGMIIKTREGRFANPGGICDLYALTWKNIDECKGKLDVKPSIKPPRQFSLENIKKPSPENGHGSSSKLVRSRNRNSKGQFAPS